MPSPVFEPGSPRPQSKSDDLDCLAMGPASIPTRFNKVQCLSSYQNITTGILMLQLHLSKKEHTHLLGLYKMYHGYQETVFFYYP